MNELLRLLCQESREVKEKAIRTIDSALIAMTSAGGRSAETWKQAEELSISPLTLTKAVFFFNHASSLLFDIKVRDDGKMKPLTHNVISLFSHFISTLLSAALLHFASLWANYSSDQRRVFCMKWKCICSYQCHSIIMKSYPFSREYIANGTIFTLMGVVL